MPSPSLALPGSAALLALLLAAPACSPTLGEFVVSGEVDDGAADDDAADDDAADDDAADDDASSDDDTAGDDDASSDDDTTPDHSEWDDAVLTIVSPQSGAFVPLGSTLHLEAVVRDADGQDTGFDDIRWTTDQDPLWNHVGASGDVSDFPVGEHVISAFAELPNGDRLGFSVGGVLVQHELAGVYTGTFGLSLSADINGTPLYTSCLGAATFEVDPYGEEIDGDAGCTIDIFGLFTQDIAFGIGGEVDPGDGHVTGELGLVIWTWELPTAFEGDFSGDGNFAGGFADEVIGVTVEGELEAVRVALTPS